MVVHRAYFFANDNAGWHLGCEKDGETKAGLMASGRRPGPIVRVVSVLVSESAPDRFGPR